MEGTWLEWVEWCRQHDRGCPVRTFIDTLHAGGGSCICSYPEKEFRIASMADVVKAPV